MKKAISVGMAALTALIITLVVTVGAVLFAMFSTSGDRERTEALFGGVFFETVPKPAGGVKATMGVGDPVVIALIFAVVFVFCLLVALFLRKLSAYRTSLKAQRAGGGMSNSASAVQQGAAPHVRVDGQGVRERA